MNRFYGESGHFPSGGSAQSGLQALQAAVLRHSLRRLSSGIPSGEVNRFHGESGHFPSGGSAQPGLQAIQAAVLWHSYRGSEPLPRGIRALSPLVGPHNRGHRLSRRLSSGIPTGEVNRFYGESGHFPPGGSAQSGLQALQAAVLRHSLRESEPLPRGIRALSLWRVRATGATGYPGGCPLAFPPGK